MDKNLLKEQDYNYNKRNVHEGHFKRLRESTEVYKLDMLNEHQRLELLLSFVSPRKDVNELAHNLLNTFGSMYNIMNSNKVQLLKVKGLSDRMATFLTLLPHFYKYYKMSNLDKDKPIQTTEDIISNFGSSISHLSNEEALVIGLSSNFMLLGYRVFTGDSTHTNIEMSDICNFLCSIKAKNAIIVHNHPSGIAYPSPSDLIFTSELHTSLRYFFKIELIEHLIVSKNSYFSFKNSLAFDIFNAVKINEKNEISKICNFEIDNTKREELKEKFRDCLNEEKFASFDSTDLKICYAFEKVQQIRKSNGISAIKPFNFE